MPRFNFFRSRTVLVVGGKRGIQNGRRDSSFHLHMYVLGNHNSILTSGNLNRPKKKHKKTTQPNSPRIHMRGEDTGQTVIEETNR